MVDPAECELIFSDSLSGSVLASFIRGAVLTVLRKRFVPSLDELVNSVPSLALREKLLEHLREANERAVVHENQSPLDLEDARLSAEVVHKLVNLHRREEMPEVVNGDALGLLRLVALDLRE